MRGGLNGSAKEALAAISTADPRDDAAAKTAELLSNRGLAEAAVDVAERIRSSKLRNEVLETIAADE